MQGKHVSSHLHVSVTQVVGPGDVLGRLPEVGTVRAGPSLSALDGNLVTSKAGTVRKTKTGKIWVEGRQKRSFPLLPCLLRGFSTSLPCHAVALPFALLRYMILSNGRVVLLASKQSQEWDAGGILSCGKSMCSSMHWSVHVYPRTDLCMRYARCVYVL